jgi:hypothetical protein
VILPAVLGVPLRYSPFFYLHLTLLHASLGLRLAGDLLLQNPVRQWGGLLNEVAVVVFILATIFAARAQIQAERSPGGPPDRAREVSLPDRTDQR